MGTDSQFEGRRGLALDGALAAAAIGAGVVALAIGEGGNTAGPASYLLVVGAGSALLARRRQPVLVLGLVAVARALVTVESGSDDALVLAAAIALFTVAGGSDRQRRLVIAVSVAIVLGVATAAAGSDDFLPEVLGEFATLLLPVAVADAVRSRADRVRDLIETEAEARVQAERLRIAQDLHDVVAHGLSTIAVQAGVAAHLIDRDPDQARDALEIINRTGRASLEELRAMVGVLRSTDDAPLRPTPGDPNDLSDLLQGAADAGVRLTSTIDGEFPDDVGERCVVAVHRIVQEALTNVARHAGGAPTDLQIRHGADEVRISVVNRSGRTPSDAVPSTGVGIVGMTERAESVGGSLRAGPTADGGFAVTATIPYQGRPAGQRTP